LSLLIALLGPVCAPGASPPPGTPIVNRASVRCADANGNPLPEISATAQVVISGAPILTVSKLESPDPVAMGALLTYTIHYQNTGNGADTEVTVTDALSRHVAFQTASGGGVFAPGENGGTVTWTLGTLEEGARGSFTVLVRVKTPSDYPAGDPDPVQSGTVIENTAKILGLGGSDQKTITTTVGEGSSLILVKSATSGPVLPGGLITYTIHYENRGNGPATAVQIRDDLPAETAIVTGSVTGGGKVQARTILWNLETVGAGSGGDVSLQVTVSPLASEGHAVRNVATISSAEQGILASNEVVRYVSATATRPSLSFTKLDTPDPVRVGNPLTYTLEITNDGTGPLTNVTVRDPVPGNTAFVEADQGGLLVAGEVVWNISTLAAGEKRTLHLVVQVNGDTLEGAIIQNQAVAVAQEIPYPSPTATTTVSARTPGRIGFYDASWTGARSYHMGDRIYLQVSDPDQNQDPSLMETVSIVSSCSETSDSETVLLTETGPDTGIFRGSMMSSPDAAVSENGVLNLAPDCVLFATYTDPFDASPVSRDSALIDPFGVVFDSVTGLPVSEAVVTLHISPGGALAGTDPLWPLGQPDTVTTGAAGTFAFPMVPPGNYYFEVKPATDHVFPSIVPDGELPPGFVVGTGSRGEVFTLAAGDPPLNLDIPVDPPTGDLVIAKGANKNSAAVGDLVRYTITLNNGGASALKTIRVVDEMPHGFNYLSGSTRLDGKAFGDPQPSGNRTLVWTVGEIPGGGSLELTYRSALGPDSLRGDGVNAVYAQGRSVGKTVTSNTARFELKVTGGVFTTKGTIIGKVFLDRDGDGLQKDTPVLGKAAALEGEEREHGIPQVILYLEDGTRVLTDQDGKFSIYGVKHGTHVLRLDESSLPEGIEPSPTSNRFAGSSSSQFVDMTPGGLFKANFAVKRKTVTAAIKAIKGPSSREYDETAKLSKGLDKKPPEPEGAIPAAELGSISPGEEEPLETWILKMSPGLDFLSPRDGVTLSRPATDVLVKAPLGAQLELQVNGRRVPETRVGRKMTNKQGKVVVYEFVGIDLLQGRGNHLKAEIRDPFGNSRGVREIHVRTLGRAARLWIRPDRKEIPADGVSTVEVTVSAYDGENNPVPLPATLTVSTTRGDILEEDADPATSGRQILSRNGVAHFRVKAPYETGEAEITVLSDELRDKEVVFFSPHLRKMLVVGVGEATLGRGKTKGNYGYLKKDRDFDEGYYAEGRAALFMKGKLYKDLLLTARYDSETEEEDEEFFRAGKNDPEAEDKYPIYGDESKLGYEATSKDKLYLRLDKGKSSLLYGDYQTELDETTLSAYNRTLNGLKSDIELHAFHLKAFASDTDQVQVVDTIQGKGVSGFYFLNHKPVLEGSEMVVLETRDRRRPDRVIKRERMTRWADYSVDYSLGSLLFKFPVPSRDEALNPVYMVVSYETEAGGSEFYNYGGRGSLGITDWLEIGLTGIAEENGVDHSHILGTDATLNLPWNTILKAEWTETKSLFDEDGTYVPKEGDGWQALLESSPFKNLDLAAYYRSVSDFFGNSSAADVSRGTEKYGVDAAYRLGSHIRLWGRYFDEKDHLNHGEYDHASLGAEKAFEFRKTKLTLELCRETSTDAYVPPSVPTTREPFDISEETPERLLAAKGGLEMELLPRLSMLLSHRQDLENNDYNLTQAGLGYKIDDRSRVYLREEYGKYRDRRETRTLMGVESEVARDTVAFSEYRLEGGADGERNQHAIGLRNKFLLGDRVTGNVSLENLQTVSGAERSSEPDAFGLSTGLEYLRQEKTKWATRLEFRRERTDPDRRTFLGELGGTHKLNPDYSLLLKARYYRDALGGEGGCNVITRTSLGLAYRPAGHDRFHALTKAEYKHEKDSFQGPGYKTDAFIASLEGVCQVSRRLQFIGKYAGKLVKDEDFDIYTDLFSARILYDITERWDAGVEYRVLQSHDPTSLLQGGSLEVGYRLVDNLWVSLGYSFDDFDSDLTDDYRGQGPYLKLRFKL